jgi:hypothetical protein
MESLLLVTIFDLIFPNVLIIGCGSKYYGFSDTICNRQNCGGKHKGIQEEELVFGFSPMANTPILLHDHNEVG